MDERRRNGRNNRAGMQINDAAVCLLFPSKVFSFQPRSMNHGGNAVAMDRNLNRIFNEFDVEGEEPEEEPYRERARYVAEHFEHKMEMVGGKLRFAQDLIALFRYFLDP